MLSIGRDVFIQLFIAAGCNKQLDYGSPPEVGEPAHPRSLGKAQLLAGLAFASALRVGLQRHPTGGLGRLPRPTASPSGTASRAGKAFSALALRGSAPSCARPAPYGAAKTPCPPPYRAGRRGVAPNELLPDLSPYGLRLVRQNSSAPPSGCRLNRGLRPHLALAGRQSAALPACGRREQRGPPQRTGSPSFSNV